MCWQTDLQRDILTCTQMGKQTYSEILSYTQIRRRIIVNAEYSLSLSLSLSLSHTHTHTHTHTHMHALMLYMIHVIYTRYSHRFVRYLGKGLLFVCVRVFVCVCVFMRERERYYCFLLVIIFYMRLCFTWKKRQASVLCKYVTCGEREGRRLF